MSFEVCSAGAERHRRELLGGEVGERACPALRRVAGPGTDGAGLRVDQDAGVSEVEALTAPLTPFGKKPPLVAAFGVR